MGREWTRYKPSANQDQWRPTKQFHWRLDAFDKFAYWSQAALPTCFGHPAIGRLFEPQKIARAVVYGLQFQLKYFVSEKLDKRRQLCVGQ